MDLLNFELLCDVAPGEAVFVSTSGEIERRICAPRTQLAPCLFEYVYLARPDSIIDGVVFQSRLRMGEKLGELIMREWRSRY